MRNTITDDVLKALQTMRTGTHLCHFYQTPQDMLDVLVPYLVAGLERNEKCLWIVDGVITIDQAKQALAEVLPHLDRHLEAGDIELFTHTEWYIVDGHFDEARVLQQFVDQEKTALEAGYHGLRVTGNTLWARGGMWEDLLAYERHVDQCFCKFKITAICTYPLDNCSAADVVDVAKAHELVLIRRDGHWDIIESATVRHIREELRESHERLKALTQQMVQIEQRERRRISYALHDGLQQTIVGTQLNLARVKDRSGFARNEVLDRIGELLNEALSACRNLTTEISPPILHERGLRPALQWLANWFTEQHQLKVHLQLPNHEPAIGNSERVTLFEVAREMLFNVLKHAGVDEVFVHLRALPERVELVVRDHGKGCDPVASETTVGSDNFGLFSIRERLRMMDGGFEFSSSPGMGSTSTVHLPILESPSLNEVPTLAASEGTNQTERNAKAVTCRA